MSRFDRRCDTEVHEVRRLEVINGDVSRRKWSAERKGEIVAESMQPGVVVSEVARRHNLNPQQLFAWRHDAKQGRLALPEEAMSFVPLVAAADDSGPAPIPSSSAMRQIEVHLGAAVIKAPEDVLAKHLTEVLRAVKAAL
ncbi:MAG: transposase [Alphaproteobacteria bacterium GM202ARS2]|nr:transposase [Alphaproteobacteria bacterium GM202ARS2]